MLRCFDIVNGLNSTMKATLTSRIAAGYRMAATAGIAAVLAACATTATVPAEPGGSALPASACHGKDPAAEAAGTQGRPPYTGKDRYANVVLRAGTVLYSLTPGAAPGFAVTEQTLRDAGGSWQAYYGLVQVTADPGTDANGKPRKLRDMVRAFHVTEALCAASGTASANPQFGAGGGTQYYVSPADAHKLRPGDIKPIAQ